MSDSVAQIIKTLAAFKIKVSLVSSTVGPRIVRHEFRLAQGVTIARVRRMSDNLTLGLSSDQVRIEAPVKGKGTIAVEVPREKVEMVDFDSVLESISPGAHPLTVVLGKDTAGKPACMNLADAPHTLVAGSTGSGKSVCLNTFLITLLHRCSPDLLRLVLIDPKRVELRPYHHVPHLGIPVACGAQDAFESLEWVAGEMDTRYTLLEHTGTRSIEEYNAVENAGHMPYLVVVVDEMADLMMVSEGLVENSICRIAQLGRACGIHLVVATQRPDRTVITGTIKANIPCRIAFSASSAIDSRVILDRKGAEDLLGKGDMLYAPLDKPDPVRLQGAYCSDDLIDTTVEAVRTAYRSVTVPLGSPVYSTGDFERFSIITALKNKGGVPVGFEKMSNEELQVMLDSRKDFAPGPSSNISVSSTGIRQDERG